MSVVPQIFVFLLHYLLYLLFLFFLNITVSVFKSFILFNLVKKEKAKQLITCYLGIFMRLFKS